MDGEGQKEETPQKETITLDLTYHEAAAFHQLYFIGALMVNGEYDRISLHVQSARAFCDSILTDDEVLSMRRKATKMVNEIPEMAYAAMGLSMRKERDKDTT